MGLSCQYIMKAYDSHLRFIFEYIMEEYLKDGCHANNSMIIGSGSGHGLGSLSDIHDLREEVKEISSLVWSIQISLILGFAMLGWAAHRVYAKVVDRVGILIAYGILTILLRSKFIVQPYTDLGHLQSGSRYVH